jgi:predicted phage terminase large subunit-like protein
MTADHQGFIAGLAGGLATGASASALGASIAFDPQLLAAQLNNAWKVTPASLAHELSWGRWVPARHLQFISAIVANKCYQALELGQDSFTIFTAPPRHGKPIHVDEPVLMGDGSYKPLGDIAVGDLVITAKARPRAVLKVYEQGLLDTVTISTRLGRMVTAAPDHFFLTHQRGWVRAGELAPRDKLVLVSQPRTSPIDSSRKAEEFRLAGYLIGDGDVSGNHYSVTAADEPIILDLKACGQVLGFTVELSPCGKYRQQFYGEGRDWIRRTGLQGTTSYTKRVPNWVFQASTDLVVEFVTAYFDCDGCVDRLGPSRQLTPSFTSVSKDLLLDVQSLLLRLGISGNITPAKSSYKGKACPSFRLTIGRQAHATRFAHLIKARSSGPKSERLTLLRENDDLILNKYFDDEVISVSPSGELPCRCLEVEEDHTFLVRDIVVHNSDLVSMYLPVWILEHYPWAKVLLTSYGADLAEGFSKRARDILIEAKGKTTTEVNTHSMRTDNWETKTGGGVLAAGIGGPIVGRGGHIIIVDDIHKNFEEAHSKAARERVIEWFRGTLFSRREPGCAMFIFAQRQHEEDLIGWLKAEMYDIFTTIDLPAVAEFNDPLDRLPGDALWPERYDVAALNVIKRSVGNYIWAAQYQQRPQKEKEAQQDSGWFRQIQPAEVPHPRHLRLVRFWDFASSEITAARPDPDYTVGALVGMDDNGLCYIIDLLRVRWTPGRVKELVKSCALNDPVNTAIRIEQEPGASGKALISEYEHDTLRGFNARGTRASGRPFLRVQPFMAAVEERRYRIVRAPWNRDFFEEFDAFPNGAHDDQMIAVAGAHDFLDGKRPRAGAFGRSSMTAVSMGLHTLNARQAKVEGQYIRGFGEVNMGATFGRNLLAASTAPAFSFAVRK